MQTYIKQTQLQNLHHFIVVNIQTKLNYLETKRLTPKIDSSGKSQFFLHNYV